VYLFVQLYRIRIFAGILLCARQTLSQISLFKGREKTPSTLEGLKEKDIEIIQGKAQHVKASGMRLSVIPLLGNGRPLHTQKRDL